jgi:hypothetical protein
LFGGGYSADAKPIGARLDLFDKLEVHELKNERFQLEHHNEHVLPKSNVLDVRLKRKLSAILPLKVVPNTHLVTRCAQHQNYEVRLVHHLY